MSSNYPLLAGNFSVDWGAARIGFTEISGLGMEIEAIEYRQGTSPNDSPNLIPGLKRNNNVILKRGIMKEDNDMFRWINTVSRGTVERRDVTISLLDERHNPVFKWILNNAWPVRYIGPTLNAGTCDIAVESLELAYESLRVEIDNL